MKGERCLVCNKIALGEPVTPQNLLESQLSALFVLQNLLELPKKSLESGFRFSGGLNPNAWLHFCKQCDKIVKKAETTFYEMKAARRKLKTYQQKIVDKLKQSTKTTPARLLPQKAKGQAKVAVMIRGFVAKHEYRCDTSNSGDSDPSSGDQTAQQLLELKQNNPSGKKLPVVVSIVKIPENPDNTSSIENDEEFVHVPEVHILENASPVERQSSEQSLVPEQHHCPECPYQTEKLFNLVAHVRKMHPEAPEEQEKKIYNCDQCDRWYDSRRRLQDHKYDRHGGRKEKKCPHCDYTTNKTYNLNLHTNLVHSDARDFTCEICGKQVKSAETLRCHQVNFHNKCSVKDCNGVFGNKQMLREHQLGVHGKEVDVFECWICLKFFARNFHLVRHLAEIHEIKDNPQKRWTGIRNTETVFEECSNE